MVYVQHKNGEALMPTTNAKARILLKSKKAKVVEIRPFTIQLEYETTDHVQDLTLGIDAGYLNIGFCVLSKSQEYLVGTLLMLMGMQKRLEERAMYRKNRRQRLRYREPRFDNRTKSKPKGWIAPSLQHKLDTHIKLVDEIKTILPIKKIKVEIANFDIQKMKDDEISGKEYQEGDMLGFYNVRKYVLHRDGHTCQNPDCPYTKKKKDGTVTTEKPVLQLHHIVFKSLGGSDNKDNLITLCTKCHTPSNHKKGKFLYDWCIEGKKVKGFRDATFMTYIKKHFVERLSETNDVDVTYGYITQDGRIKQGLDKTHYNDAFVIAGGNATHKRKSKIDEIQQVRRNNRSLEKFYDAQYIDSRIILESPEDDGSKKKKKPNNVVYGKALFNGRTTRNKNLNTENLHKYRQEKVKKGGRSIRRTRYFYQPNDLVIVDGKQQIVQGTHNNGERVLMRNGKSIAIKNITPYKFMQGFVWNF